MKIVWDEKGVALFTAMTLIMLISGMSLFILQNAATEKMIAAHVKREAVGLALAESGVEQVLYWMAQPAQSPDQDFFSKRVCYKGDSDFLSKTAFPSDLGGGGGGTLRVHYKEKHPDGRCTVEVATVGGKGIRVDIGPPPLPKMVAPIIGPNASGDTESQPQVIWCEGPCLIDSPSPPNHKAMSNIKSFIRRYGRTFTVSSNNCLEEFGVVEEDTDCRSFKQLFSVSPGEWEQKEYDLAYIDSPGSLPFIIDSASYKGYFYFTGDVLVKGSDEGDLALHLGMNIHVKRPSETFGITFSETLDNISLDGLLYTAKKMILNNTFKAYGALYAGEGFEGNLSALHVWYNRAFALAAYEGVVPMIRVPGTWEVIEAM